MSIYAYPYDDTGNASTNLVINDKQVLTAINANPYRFFIPTFAPFYLHNLVLTAKDNLGATFTLTQGIDYNPIVKYIAATRANGAVVYGGISVIKDTIQGEITLQYQCLGGAYSADRDFVTAQIAQHNYNPRVCSWDQLTSVQTTFPPSSHPQDLDTFTGLRNLIDSIDNVTDAIAQGPNPSAAMVQHMLDYNDPHKTLLHIGGGGGGGGGSVVSVAGKSGVVLLNKNDVGLDRVDNTSDLDKPVSIAVAGALFIKANRDSPAFTGDPTAPTPDVTSNNTTLATTAFVKAGILDGATPKSHVNAIDPHPQYINQAELTAALANLPTPEDSKTKRYFYSNF